MKRLFLTFAFVSLLFSTVWYAGVYADYDNVIGDMGYIEASLGREVPLIGAQVLLYKEVVFTAMLIDTDITDADGEFQLTTELDGNYRIEVIKDGSYCLIKQFTVNSANVDLGHHMTYTCTN